MLLIPQGLLASAKARVMRNRYPIIAAIVVAVLVAAVVTAALTR